jgi:hypothetical protein
MALKIMAFSVTIRKCDAQHNGTQHIDIQQNGKTLVLKACFS